MFLIMLSNAVILNDTKENYMTYKIHLTMKELLTYA